MGHLLSAIVLSLSSNVDNFAIGIAYGVKKLKIGKFGNLLIALVSALGTYSSMSLGAVISRYLDPNVANFIGSFVLIAIGVWGIWDTFKTAKRNKDNSFIEELSYETFVEDPARADLDHSRVIDVKESIPLAFALTINNLGSGVGGGISGLNIILTTILTFIFSILAIVFGYIIGERFTARMSGKWPGLVSGCMMISIGIYEYFN